MRETISTSREDLLIQVTDDGSRTLAFVDGEVAGRDSFHSGSGAASESQQVYLENSGVADRMRQGLEASVLEIGLGTGLAMLMTVDLAIKTKTPLHYRALEIDWIDGVILEQLELHRWLEFPNLAAQMIEWRNRVTQVQPGRCYHWQPEDRIRVEVLIEDAERWEPEAGERYDAVYFDPFCDRTDPQLWTTAQFGKLRSVMKSAGCLATYACARRIRDSISAARFDCRKAPGPPGGKRETLVAYPTAGS